MTDHEYLRKITYDGAYKKYGEKLSDIITQRIEIELDVMKRNNFSSYD